VIDSTAKERDALAKEVARLRAENNKISNRQFNNVVARQRDAMAKELTQLQAKLKKAEGRVKKHGKDGITTAELRKELYGLSEVVPKPPKWISRPDTRASNISVPVTWWSDWHAGEIVRPEEIDGLNEFNKKICRERIGKLVDTTVELCKKHMGNDIKYPGIVCGLGGDMISGDIHEELTETNEEPTPATLLWLQDDIAAGLTHFADKFGRVFVPCVVGNHGRTTRKPRAKHRAFTSYEWSLYQQLARHFKNDDRFTFCIPDGPDIKFEVLGNSFLLTHGDSLGTKGGDGIIGAIGPIARGTFKINRNEANIGRSPGILLCGHWHTYIPAGAGNPFAVNGALKGYDEYAHTLLRVPYSRPSQSLMFVNKDHGITAQWEVKLNKQRKAEPTKHWVSF
jgi:hypothetical protein